MTNEQPEEIIGASQVTLIRVELTRGCGITFCKNTHTHEGVRRFERYYLLDGTLIGDTDPGWENKPGFATLRKGCACVGEICDC